MLGMDNSTLNLFMLDKVMGPMLEPLLTAVPMVGDHSTERVDNWREAWDFAWGFKDGVVGVTGKDSKAFLCNGNVSITDKVFYYDYVDAINNATKWTEAETEKSLLEFAYLITASM